MNSITPINNTRLITICIIAFTGFLFLFNIGKRDLWAPDEPRYAQVSKEMRDSGNFIVPHLNGEPYPDKPPLLFWLINLFSIPFGKITALSSRLPSAFAGIGCCLALFFLAKSLYHNTRIALLAALFLATSSKFLWMAHRVAFDVLLTFFATMAILCFYKGYIIRHNRSPITSPISPPLQWKDEGEVKKQERRYYILFYIFMALGVLTKGPVGFILPFFIVLTYLILKKDLRVLKETRPWIGGVIFAFIVFTWVYLASVYGGKEYACQILFKQNVGRFASSFAHKRPFYYYFINFPINFVPWSIFIPGIAVYLSSKEGRTKIQNILMPVIWFAVVFIFFSIVSGKRDIYVLPLYPAAALITAWFLNEFVEQFREKRFKRIGYYPCYLLCGITLALSTLLPIVVYKLYPQYTSSAIPFVAILLIGGLVMLRFVRYARIIPFLFTIIFVIFFAFNISTLKAIPILNQYKSAKEICDKANSVIKHGEKLAMYDFFRDPYLFYTNINHIEVLYGIDELRRFLNSNERVFLFIQEKDFKEVSKLLEIPMFVLEKDSVGHRDILFVSNKDI
ncbi:MAG TPA: ArnT family glycosyltransferase [Candidatus Wunengus sp. YC60]|uniref:ArnT family glycosyltransferase n=1 Tax=Candidatus Wunengus sp. YC60 TaxID=3367697 RepID=UPI004029E6C2